jgi:hypothetical protein
MPAVIADKKSVHIARVLASDEVRDLALIKVDQIPAEASPIGLGDSSALQVGSDVHAIGHPEGAQWTYTRGFVSQLRPSFEWKYTDGTQHKANVIQTQTPIAPGNSGGPLLDDEGKLVGVNSFSKAEGGMLNYAVASDEVSAFLTEVDNKARPSTVQSECKNRVINDGFDARYPQYATITRFDRNCDGQADADILISKDRSSPIYLIVDSQFIGKIDQVVVDEDRDRKWDVSYYDRNNDGNFDLIGYHPDGSLTASRYEEVRPPLTYVQVTSR